MKVNIEANHATLAGHSFEHEIAMAAALGIFGSIDMNRGDEQSGWDTDQFPNNVEDAALALYEILKAGGLGSGGLNFDTKVRRQSIASDDLLIAHASAIDVCARALLVAAAMIEDGKLVGAVNERYRGWAGAAGQAILKASAASPRSPTARRRRMLIRSRGQAGQEAHERLVSRYL